MNKWRVIFIDNGNCEILQIEVECYRITNAAKVALKRLTEEQEKTISAECVEMKVQKA